MSSLSRRVVLCITLSTLGWISIASGRAPILAPSEQASKVVEVRDVRATGGVVSAVLVNKSPRLVRDVRLLVRHAWLWKNERHPGEDNPGRSEYYTVNKDVQPGSSVAFTYEPTPPLPVRADGRFETSLQVVGFTEVGE